MKRVLAVSLSAALLAAASLPALAEGGCGSKAVSASAQQTRTTQTAQAQTGGTTVR